MDEGLKIGIIMLIVSVAIVLGGYYFVTKNMDK